MSDEFDIEMEGDDLDVLLSSDGDDGPDLFSSSWVPDLPHWRFDRRDFAHLLKVVSTFPSHVLVFFIVRREGDCIVVHVNNKDVVLNYRIPLLNKESAPDPGRDYFLDYRVLSQFAAVFLDFALGFDSDGRIHFLSQGADYQLEVLPLTFDRMGIVDGSDNPSLQWSSFPLSKVQVGTLKSLFGFAVSITDNKVYFGPDFVDSFFSMYQHRFEGLRGGPVPTYLRKADISVIHEVAGPETTMAVGDKRVYVRFPQGTLSFLRITGDYKAVSLARGDEVGRFTVDAHSFERAVRVTQILSIPQVDFVSEGGRIVMLVGSKARFVVGTGTLAEDVSLSIGLMARLVSTIDPAATSFQARFTSSSVELLVDCNGISRYIFTRTSIAGYKREVKIQEKIDNREQRMESRTARGKMSENLAEASESLDELLSTF